MTYTLPQRVLLGLAVGDALGAAREFKRPAPYPHLEYTPGSPFGFAPGEATDDTQMTIAGLIATTAHTPPGLPTLPSPARYAQRTHTAFARWADSGPPDIGGQTSRACRGGIPATVNAYHDARSNHREASAGNGGLMRAAAPFLAGLRQHALLSATVIHTAVTHYEPRCLTDAVAFAWLLEAAETEGDFAEAVRQAAADITQPLPLTRIADAARDGLKLNAEQHALLRSDLLTAAQATQAALLAARMGQDTTPTGFTTDTLQNAVMHTITERNTADPYGNTIRWAASAGGDADTIACVAGALAAAYDPLALARATHTPLVRGLRVGHAWADWPDRAEPAAPRLLNLLAAPVSL